MVYGTGLLHRAVAVLTVVWCSCWAILQVHAASRRCGWHLCFETSVRTGMFVLRLCREGAAFANMLPAQEGTVLTVSWMNASLVRPGNGVGGTGGEP
jgi:hypothetical protein